MVQRGRGLWSSDLVSSGPRCPGAKADWCRRINAAGLKRQANSTSTSLRECSCNTTRTYSWNSPNFLLLSAWCMRDFVPVFLVCSSFAKPPGYSVGLLVSATMLGRIVGSYFWGVVADRYGRRPVIFVSLWATAAFAVAFGLSTTFSWALTFRYERYLVVPYMYVPDTALKKLLRHHRPSFVRVSVEIIPARLDVLVVCFDHFRSTDTIDLLRSGYHAGISTGSK